VGKIDKRKGDNLLWTLKVKVYGQQAVAGLFLAGFVLGLPFYPEDEVILFPET
jgi:hypothetical protein